MTEHRIILTPSDWTWAEQVGRARDTASKAAGYVGRNGQSSDRSLINHVEGAAAELAVAKACGVRWPAHVNTYQREPDLIVPRFGGVEVKWTNGTGLIIRESAQRTDDVHVLVSGSGAIKRIVGWCTPETVAWARTRPMHRFENGRADAWLLLPEELEEWGTFPKEVIRV